MTRVEFEAVRLGFCADLTRGPFRSSRACRKDHMMPTTVIENRKIAQRHRARGKQSAFRRHSEESGTDEVQLLRQQVMHLRSTVAEQEEKIAFLKDMLAERWFEAE